MVCMQERKVAVDSLRSVAGLLSDSYSGLHEAVFGRTDVPENHTLDTFFSTVKATADVRTTHHLPLGLRTDKKGLIWKGLIWIMNSPLLELLLEK